MMIKEYFVESSVHNDQVSIFVTNTNGSGWRDYEDLDVEHGPIPIIVDEDKIERFNVKEWCPKGSKLTLNVDDMRGMSNLKKLSLTGCRIIGNAHDLFSNMKNLTSIKMLYCIIEDYTGMLESISKVSSLETLILDIVYPIDTTSTDDYNLDISSMSNLLVCRIDDTKISSMPIPPVSIVDYCFAQYGYPDEYAMGRLDDVDWTLYTDLMGMYIEGTNIEGTVPASLLELPNLIELELYENLGIEHIVK